MLPPDLAAFSFSADSAGSDEAVASRTALVVPTGTVTLCGARRHGLIVALARRGLDVVVLDASRTALPDARTAAEHAGVLSRVTLFAADPRDFEVPGGTDAVLVTSGAYRVLTFAAARRAALACIRRALRPAGALLVDLDRVPPPAATSDEFDVVRTGPGRQTWSARRFPAIDGAESRVVVRCESPGVARVEVELHDLTPEAVTLEIANAGLSCETFDDALTGGPATGASKRTWIVARRRGASS